MQIKKRIYKIVRGESPEGYDVYWIKKTTYLFGCKAYTSYLSDFEVEHDGEVIEVPFFSYPCAINKLQELRKN